MISRDIFVNYFRDDSRDSPFNLAAARTILGIYLIWKVSSVPWRELKYWPLESLGRFQFLMFDVLVNNAELIYLTTLITLLAFTLGYRTRISGLLSAIQLSSLGSILFLLSDSGSKNAFFIASYIITFFVVYAETDRLSLDGIREALETSSGKLDRRIQEDREAFHRMHILKWSLVTLGLLYFMSALSKIIYSGPGWISGMNLGRFMVWAHGSFGIESYLGGVLLENGILLSAAANISLIVEVSLLVATLLGITVTPSILLLLVFHLMVFLVLGPIFLDQVLLLSLFLPWDRLHNRLSRDITVIYSDESTRWIRFSYIISLFPHADSFEHVQDRESLGNSLIAVEKPAGISKDAGAVESILKSSPVLFPIGKVWEFAPLSVKNRILGE